MAGCGGAILVWWRSPGCIGATNPPPSHRGKCHSLRARVIPSFFQEPLPTPRGLQHTALQIQIHKYTSTNTQIHKCTNAQIHIHVDIWGLKSTRECCLNSSTMYNAKYTLMHNILPVYITFSDPCWQCLIMSAHSRVMLGDVLYRGGRRLGSVDGSLDNYLFAGAMIPGKHIHMIPNNL